MTPDKMPPGPLTFHMVPLLAGKPYRGRHRYAIYLASPDDRIGPLWGTYTPPETTDAERRALAPKIWPSLVYFPRPETRLDALPAYHFALDFAPAGWSTNERAQEFAQAMARHLARPVTIRILHGWNASAHHGTP
jgi:hypothetical protein